MSLARIAAVALATMAALAITGWNADDQAGPFAGGLAGVVATADAAAPSMAQGGQVGFQSFHDRLAPYGTWMNHSRWGAVWRPNVGRGFRPYRDGGHWENTDDYGTVWVSDYAWGDVPFHYGRWAYDPVDGWVWVPGYVWGPAWVIWRAGAGDIGWLPMPPWIAYDGYGDFPDDWNDWYGYAGYGYPEDEFYSFWSFVDAGDLFAPSISYYVIGPAYYRRFIGRTVGWTRFSIYNGHVFNRSIDRDRFRATFGHDWRAGRRHDFAGRLGPVVNYASGRQIQAHEHGIAHVLPAVQSTPHTRYEIRRSTTGHTYRSNSVNVIRGGTSETPAIHHTHTRSHTGSSGSSPVHHYTPTYHSGTTYHATPAYHTNPTYHAAPTYHYAPAPHGSFAPATHGTVAPAPHGVPPSHGSTPPGKPQ